MKRFFTRLFRFFWSWGFLKFVLFAITLIVLLYVEEDWRGARAWAATKAKWEARGETFDLRAFTPPEIPGSENLAALPLFRITRIGGKFGYDELVDFRRANHNGVSGVDSFVVGSWQSGRLTDMVKFRQTLAIDFTVLFKGQPTPSDALAQFEAMYPFVGELRAATALRSSFRLDLDYGGMPPAGRSLGPVTDMITLAKITTDHAVLALDEKRTDLALDDVKVNVIVAKGVARDPTLVSGLVEIGMMAISEGAIYHGLAEHEWSDMQLCELEQTLGSLHFLADYQYAMRAEAAEVATNIAYFKPISRWKPEILGLQDTVGRRSPAVWPGGWWDNNSRLLADFFFAEKAVVDPQAQLVFPAKADELADEAAHASWTPWSFWYALSAPVMSGASSKYAQAQVWADEARIACAVERYRLAHGAYPAALDTLAQQFIDAVPHDVMNGEPYRYRLNADGTYVLYSVGWNQRDDGGSEAKEQNGVSRDYTKGDWVWPTPKR